MMSYERVMRALALIAILPAGGTLYSFVFWGWFSYWRRHRVQTYVLILGIFLLLGVPLYVLRGVVLAERLRFPLWVQAAGWTVVTVATPVTPLPCSSH